MNGMKAYILDLGTMQNDKGIVSPSYNRWTKSNPNPPVEYVNLPCYSVLVDHPTAGKFLYDLSFNPECCNEYSEIWPNSWYDRCPCHREEGQDMISQLALCGTKPEDIQNIILSHLHWDHTGYLPMFEHCDAYAPEKSMWDAFVKIRTQNILEQYPYYQVDLNTPVKHFYPISDDEEDVELFPGVHLINLPGHAPALLGMILELEGGNIFFPSDACYTEANLNMASSNVYDSISYMKSLKKIKKYAAKYKAKIIYMHDEAFFKELKKAPACFE